MSFWNRKPVRTGPKVYVVSSREVFAKWLQEHQDNNRYENIHNEACAHGLVHLFPPVRFVVLPSAEFSVLLYLHTRGFHVNKPVPHLTEREKQIALWKEKLARFAGGSSRVGVATRY